MMEGGGGEKRKRATIFLSFFPSLLSLRFCSSFISSHHHDGGLPQILHRANEFSDQPLLYNSSA